MKKGRERPKRCKSARLSSCDLWQSRGVRFAAGECHRGGVPGCGGRAEALACALSAGTGELLTTVLFYPIELVKARLQAAVRCDAKGSFAYNNAFDGLLCIAREDRASSQLGPLGLGARMDRMTAMRSMCGCVGVCLCVCRPWAERADQGPGCHSASPRPS